MLSKLFSNPELDAFARALANELANRYPPDLEAERAAGGGSRSEKRLARALENVYGQARAFRRSRRLGVYRKARLGNVFKWSLRERGYSEGFVEETTKALVLAIPRD